MSQGDSLAERKKEIERETTRAPRNFVERLVRLGAEFVLAIAFFLLGLTDNIIATALVDDDKEGHGAVPAFVLATVGIVCISIWKLARQWEEAIHEARDQIRDQRLAIMIADEMERRQRMSVDR